ncbi:uncharacterized protein LOC124466091 [Hypomesus transpacificus]|uniref:uncharacterized protein LOC124466091 n=1 Tax=Hypomesus transpacificus TaxID=137520 RepID=UPI001F075455|nr:uncharacterized protein LOC124466091 [Hypomesus transpacificus]
MVHPNGFLRTRENNLLTKSTWTCVPSLALPEASVPHSTRKPMAWWKSSMAPFKGALKKMVKGHPCDWDEYLKPTVFGLRTKKQLTTKYSPYFLMYGREARYPSEIPDKWQITDEEVNVLVGNQEVSLTSSLTDVYPKVENNILAGQERVRKRKLSMGQDDGFVVGDLVLRKNICQEQRKGGKMEADLLGPYTIVNIDKKSADLQTEGQIFEKINIDHLKKCVEPQPRIPAKWIAASMPPPALQLIPSTLPPALQPIPSTPPPALQPIPSTPPPALQPIPSTPPPALQPIPSTPPPALQPSPQSCTLATILQSPVCQPSNSLTPEELIAEIWSGKRQGVLWSKVGPYKLFARDLLNLAPGREVESEVTAWWSHRSRLPGPNTSSSPVIYPKEKRALYINPLGETPDQIKNCKDITRSVTIHVSKTQRPFAELVLNEDFSTGDFSTDEAATIQWRREITCRLDATLHCLRLQQQNNFRDRSQRSFQEEEEESRSSV